MAELLDVIELLKLPKKDFLLSVNGANLNWLIGFVCSSLFVESAFSVVEAVCSPILKTLGLNLTVDSCFVTELKRLLITLAVNLLSHKNLGFSSFGCSSVDDCSSCSPSFSSLSSAGLSDFVALIVEIRDGWTMTDSRCSLLLSLASLESFSSLQISFSLVSFIRTILTGDLSEPFKSTVSSFFWLTFASLIADSVESETIFLSIFSTVK